MYNKTRVLVFIWFLCFTDTVIGRLVENEVSPMDSLNDLPYRHKDKYSSPTGLDSPDYAENYHTENRISGYGQRCSDKLETALEDIRKRQISKRKTFDLDGSLHEQLRSAPYDLYVSDLRVRLPPSNSWVKVDKCRFNPRNASLETRLLFYDLTISGKVNLFNEDEVQRENFRMKGDEACNMILRLRKAGIGFFTEPIRRKRGNFNVRTDSHFVEPGFISVYAYGCEPPLTRSELREDDYDDLSREMEDIFLKGIRSLLMSYMQKELQPAIKETLLKNMGYTLSYG